MEHTNQEYYRAESPGRTDYWKKMAAPRFRMEVILGILEDHPMTSLSDLGCGSGELLGPIHARFSNAALCGIDASAAQIASNRVHNPAVDWRSFDLDQTVEFPKELKSRFDVVIASEIIEHVHHPDILLQNARRLA